MALGPLAGIIAYSALPVLFGETEIRRNDKMDLSRSSFAFIIFVVCFLLGTISNAEPQPNKKQYLSEKLYNDPKGFFRIRPPEGWQVQEFGEDPRGKVKLICPTAYNTVLQVIGMASSFSNFEELVRDSEAAAERLRNKVNGSITTEKISFANVPAVKMTITIPEKLKQVQIVFLLGKNHYALVFGSPPYTYEKFFPTAMMSIESFEPILKDVTKEEAMKHTVASKLRTAKLLLQAGQKEYAITVINEGLQLDSNNKELRELKKQIEEK